MHDLDWDSLLLLALLWSGYCVVHSLLASNRAKQWGARRWPQGSSRYRLIYNSSSLILLVPPVWLFQSLRGPMIWQWSGALDWTAQGLAALALVGALATLRYYDAGEFLGLRPPAARGLFVISPFHRFVRHPWYFFALVLLWTRDMDAALLVTAVALTLYFVIGSRLEEQKLVAEYGNTYRRYMASVPGLVPRPTRFLSVENAERLVGVGSRTEGSN